MLVVSRKKPNQIHKRCNKRQWEAQVKICCFGIKDMICLFGKPCSYVTEWVYHNEFISLLFSKIRWPCIYINEFSLVLINRKVAGREKEKKKFLYSL